MFLACFKNVFSYMFEYFWGDCWHILGNYFLNCFPQILFLIAFTHQVQRNGEMQERCFPRWADDKGALSTNQIFFAQVDRRNKDKKTALDLCKSIVIRQ